MAAKTHVRLHYESGKVITESLVTMARENGVSVGDARRMIELWAAWGDLEHRPDGGYNVVRRRGRKDPQTLAALKPAHA